MPKVMLRFDLPEEKYEYDLAMKGADFSGVLGDLDKHLRNQIKYVLDPGPLRDELQRVRDQLHSYCNDRGIEL